MKVSLDTCAINWLCDNPEAAAEFLDAHRRGRFVVVVSPEAAAEIRRTPVAERRAALEAMLANFFPLTPTRHPRAGVRSGMGRIPTARDEARLEAIGFLNGIVDRVVASNAAGERCDVVLTTDSELWKRKRKALEEQLGGTKVLHPFAFLAMVRTQSGGRGVPLIPAWRSKG